MSREAKNENDRIPSFESVPIHHNFGTNISCGKYICLSY